MTEPLYTRDILRLAASIPGQRSFDEIEWAGLRSPTCGSRVATRVTLDPERRVTKVEQAVEACAFGQASAALVGAGALGLDLADAKAAERRIADWLDGVGPEPFPGMAVLDVARARQGRHGAILLPFRALIAAIERAA